MSPQRVEMKRFIVFLATTAALLLALNLLS
jgi:hypothetical protein